MFPLSACVFIKDNFKGAFCLFESMAMLLPLVSEFIVMDLGSTDGTLEVLENLEKGIDILKVVKGNFEKTDAGDFADLANELIHSCYYSNVLYYQADEVWHENLINLMVKQLEAGEFDLSFWRIQYQENFQKVKWFPHPVHRVGRKGHFNFVGDGMNSDRVFDTKMCSNFDMGYFTKWGEMNPLTLPVNEMITDVSLIGGFLGNIPERKRMHAPFWNERALLQDLETEEMMEVDDWYKKQLLNENWFKTTSPFDIPVTLRHHLGKQMYEFWLGLHESMIQGNTREFLGLNPLKIEV